MRVLLDQNIPRGLRALLHEHEVTTADEAGWARLSNGDLLRAAEGAGFEVFVSADQNLSYQQNFEGRSLAIVILGANHWLSLRAAGDRIARSVGEAGPGSYQTLPIARVD